MVKRGQRAQPKSPKLPRGLRRLRYRSHSQKKIETVPTEPGLQLTVDVSVEVDEDLPDDQVQDQEDQITQALDSAGQSIVDLAGTLVPVKTGFLRDSLYYVVDDGQLVLTVGADADYAPVVEAHTPFLDLPWRLSHLGYKKTLTLLSKTVLRILALTMKVTALMSQMMKVWIWNSSAVWRQSKW